MAHRVQLVIEDATKLCKDKCRDCCSLLLVNVDNEDLVGAKEKYGELKKEMDQLTTLLHLKDTAKALPDEE